MCLTWPYRAVPSKVLFFLLFKNFCPRIQLLFSILFCIHMFKIHTSQSSVSICQKDKTLWKYSILFPNSSQYCGKSCRNTTDPKWWLFVLVSSHSGYASCKSCVTTYTPSMCVNTGSQLLIEACCTLLKHRSLLKTFTACRLTAPVGFYNNSWVCEESTPNKHNLWDYCNEATDCLTDLVLIDNNEVLWHRRMIYIHGFVNTNNASSSAIFIKHSMLLL